MRYKRRKGKQITKAKKHTEDGITFASGLELYCYRALNKAKIPHEYEGNTFELVDFINLDAGFIIETKGLRTPIFSMRFKLFLKYLHDSDQKLDVYIPSNQKEVNATIESILSRGTFKNKKK